MVKKKSALLIFLSILLVSISIYIFRAQNPTEKPKIKDVIIKALITLDGAFAKEVEYGGKTYIAQSPDEILTSQKELADNKEGYIDGMDKLLKIYIGPEERRPRDERKVYKKFDFRWIWISFNGKTATAKVDVYFDLIKKMPRTPNRDWIMKGGDRHYFKLEKNNDKWLIVSDDWDFLPEYRP